YSAIRIKSLRQSIKFIESIRHSHPISIHEIGGAITAIEAPPQDLAKGVAHHFQKPLVVVEMGRRIPPRVLLPLEPSRGLCVIHSVRLAHVTARHGPTSQLGSHKTVESLLAFPRAT